MAKKMKYISWNTWRVLYADANWLEWTVIPLWIALSKIDFDGIYGH
jgi:hypothetical protein